MSIDWNELVRGRIREVLEPVHTFVDVGASEGVIAQAAVGRCRRVVLFEPNKKNCVALRKLPGATVENKAVSDHTGVVKLFDSSVYGCTGGNILGYDVTGAEGRLLYDVDCVTLDVYFADAVVNVLKIDVEGAEKYVLAGALNILRRDYPVLFLECHYDADWLELTTLLRGVGYELRDLVTLELCGSQRSYQVKALQAR